MNKSSGCITCGKIIRARNLCPNHYEQWRREHKKDIKHKVYITIGNTYGKLLVLEQVENTNKKATYRCVCSCGNTTEVKGTYLTNGDVKSCGCLRRKRAKDLMWLDGRTSYPEYSTWKSMLDRCNNPNNHAYHHYGGRGISVCSEWSDFHIFLSDLGSKPTKRHSLDRIDNNGNYELSNCRWATALEQARNRRLHNVPATRLQELIDKELLLKKYIDKYGILNVE